MIESSPDSETHMREGRSQCSCWKYRDFIALTFNQIMLAGRTVQSYYIQRRWEKPQLGMPNGCYNLPFKPGTKEKYYFRVSLKNPWTVDFQSLISQPPMSNQAFITRKHSQFFMHNNLSTWFKLSQVWQTCWDFLIFCGVSFSFLECYINSLPQCIESVCFCQEKWPLHKSDLLLSSGVVG